MPCWGRGRPVSDLVVEHVRREVPPWRSANAVTECGLPVGGHPVISREDFVAKVKAQGQQRAAMSTCMTCWDSARRNAAWEDNPVDSLIREAERHRWGGRNGQRDVEGFRNELRAIAVLIETHRDEFDGLVAGLGETVRLDSLRAKRRYAR